MIPEEGRILNAIRQAKLEQKKVLRIGIPQALQNEITSLFDSDALGVDLKLKNLYGIPVVNSEELEVTIAI